MRMSSLLRATAIGLCSLLPVALHAQSIGTFIGLAASPTSAYQGQPVNLTATLSVTSGSVSALNGFTLQFESPSGVLGSATIENGTATIQVFPFTSTVHGNYDNFTAVYSGNATFEGSAGMTTVLDLGPGPGVAALQGSYAFLFSGTTNVAALTRANRIAGIGSLHFDGQGVVSGEEDYNTGAGAVLNTPVSGSYYLDATGTGLLTIEGSDNALEHFALFAQAAPGSATADTASMMQIDGNVLFGNVELKKQTYTGAGFTPVQGAYVLKASGETSGAGSVSTAPDSGLLFAAGQLTFTSGGTGGTVTGPIDLTAGTSVLQNSPVSGATSAPDSFGRFALTLTTPNQPPAQPTDYVAYIVDGMHIYLLSVDTHAQYNLISGELAQ